MPKNKDIVTCIQSAVALIGDSAIVTLEVRKGNVKVIGLESISRRKDKVPKNWEKHEVSYFG